MDKVNSTSIAVRAIDSRGNSTTVTRSNITNIAYSDISISKFTVDRKDGVSTAMILTLQGRYSNTNFGAVTNSVKTAQIRYKATSSNTWGSWINVLSLITRSNGNITASAVEVPSQTFTVGTTYDVQIQLIDELSAVTLQTTLNSGKPIYSAVKGRGMAINGLYDTSKGGALQVFNGDANFDEAIRMSKGSATNRGILNSDGSPILQDFDNQNVVVNATGEGLFLGWANTTKIDILKGKAMIASNGQYKKASGSGWYNARDQACLRNTNGSSDGGWHPILSQKTTNGDWAIGQLSGEDSLRIAYTTDTNYNNKTNSSSSWTLSTGGVFSGKSATAGNADTVTATETNPSSSTYYRLMFAGQYGANTSMRGNNGLQYCTREGTASQEGYAILQLGNSKANGTAGNKRGYLMLYGTTAYYTYLVSGAPTANRTLTCPNHSGTIMVRPTLLYSNSSGTNGTVTLSASISNYTFCSILFRDDQSRFYTAFINTPSGREMELTGAGAFSKSGTTMIKSRRVKLSGTSISNAKGDGDDYGSWQSYGNSMSANNQIYIISVYGWT
jgi:hypothetical protein